MSKKALQITGLPKEILLKDIREVFASFGSILNLRSLPSTLGNLIIIEYQSEVSARKAIDDLSGLNIFGYEVSCDYFAGEMNEIQECLQTDEDRNEEALIIVRRVDTSEINTSVGVAKSIGDLSSCIKDESRVSSSDQKTPTKEAESPNNTVKIDKSETYYVNHDEEKQIQRRLEEKKSDSPADFQIAESNLLIPPVHECSQNHQDGRPNPLPLEKPSTLPPSKLLAMENESPTISKPTLNSSSPPLVHVESENRINSTQSNRLIEPEIIRSSHLFMTPNATLQPTNFDPKDLIANLFQLLMQVLQQPTNRTRSNPQSNSLSQINPLFVDVSGFQNEINRLNNSLIDSLKEQANAKDKLIAALNNRRRGRRVSRSRSRSKIKSRRKSSSSTSSSRSSRSDSSSRSGRKSSRSDSSSSSSSSRSSVSSRRSYQNKSSQIQIISRKERFQGVSSISQQKVAENQKFAPLGLNRWTSYNLQGNNFSKRFDQRNPNANSHSRSNSRDTQNARPYAQYCRETSRADGFTSGKTIQRMDMQVAHGQRTDIEGNFSREGIQEPSYGNLPEDLPVMSESNSRSAFDFSLSQGESYPEYERMKSFRNVPSNIKLASPGRHSYNSQPWNPSLTLSETKKDATNRNHTLVINDERSLKADSLEEKSKNLCSGTNNEDAYNQAKQSNNHDQQLTSDQSARNRMQISGNNPVATKENLLEEEFNRKTKNSIYEKFSDSNSVTEPSLQSTLPQDQLIHQQIKNINSTMTTETRNERSTVQRVTPRQNQIIPSDKHHLKYQSNTQISHGIQEMESTYFHPDQKPTAASYAMHAQNVGSRNPVMIDNPNLPVRAAPSQKTFDPSQGFRKMDSVETCVNLDSGGHPRFSEITRGSFQGDHNDVTRNGMFAKSVYEKPLGEGTLRAPRKGDSNVQEEIQKSTPASAQKLHGNINRINIRNPTREEPKKSSGTTETKMQNSTRGPYHQSNELPNITQRQSEIREENVAQKHINPLEDMDLKRQQTVQKLMELYLRNPDDTRVKKMFEK